MLQVVVWREELLKSDGKIKVSGLLSIPHVFTARSNVPDLDAWTSYRDFTESGQSSYRRTNLEIGERKKRSIQQGDQTSILA